MTPIPQQWFAVTAIGLSLGLRTGQAEPRFTLVQDGHPKATIVTAAAPNDNTREAAAELQRYVRKITGAELPIVNDEHPPAGPLILVGTNRLTAQRPEWRIPSGLTPRLREEGLVIRCQGDRLLLAGNDAGPYYGTRYAVAECLHQLGVRWFMPGEFGEVVPRATTLSFPKPRSASGPISSCAIIGSTTATRWARTTPSGRSTTK